MKTNTTATREKGFVVGMLLSLIIIISLLLLTITSSAIGNWQSATSENARANAQFAADAGLDVGIHEVNLAANTATPWMGTAGQANADAFDQVELFNNGDIRTTYEVEVTDVSTTQKTVKSTGRTFRPASSTTAKATRIFEMELEEVTTGFGPGSVVSGVGGLILENNARITGGDVIVNGTVLIENNAQIGLSSTPVANAVNLRVAHQSCPNPVDATYPQPCIFGEPITNNGLIYAHVEAQNQSMPGTNMFNPGLQSSTFAPVAVPGYDRPTHKAAVNPGDVHPPTASEVRCSGNSADWDPNIRITGDFHIPNNCDVTINGNVWIDGDLTMGNNANIVVSDTLTLLPGWTRPVVMIDGEDGLATGNNNEIISNAANVGVEIVTVWWNTDTVTNGGFDCGGIADPYDCTSVTGLALSTSQSQTTIDLANNTDASGTVFRTLWSRAEVSNNGALGAVSGQTIELKQNAVINFTASISGSDNLRFTWVKRGYLRVFQ